ncbi:MAG TPA: PQQ-binding-like beta-propeller repeat protein [Planctomycetota bacterium]
MVLALLLALQTDWPRWRGADGSGVSPEALKAEALARPKLLFRAQLGEGLSSVSIVAGKLYTLGNQGGQDVVSCLDAKTGKPVWRFPYKCPAGNFNGPRATPTVHGGLVYTLSRNGQAFALDAVTGEPKWQADLAKLYGAKTGDYGITGSPLVLGDALVFNACAKGVALNRTSGEKLWASAAGTSGFASPVAVDGSVALFTASSLSILDPATGRELSAFAWQTSFDANAADPVLFDGKLFITSGWDKGCALLKLENQRLSSLWQNTEIRSQIASPVHLDGRLFGIDDNTPNGQLKCLDAKTGKPLWSRKGGFGNLLAAGGKLLSIDRTGLLVVVDADGKDVAKAQVLGRAAKNWTAPVLCDGLLYCRDGEGLLVCLDLR